MRVYVKVLAWGIIGLAPVVLALPATALEFRPARELRFYGGAIAMRKDQRVVMYEPKLLATGALAVVPLPSERTAPVLRGMARQRYGETAWQEEARSGFNYRGESHGPSPERREQRLLELRAAGVTVDAYREIMYRSGAYNVWKVLGWTRGHSVLTLGLLDGKALFGRASTVIRLQRKDEVWAWGWIAHNPIPSFHRQGEKFVGEEEIVVVQDLAKTLGAPVAFYPELNYWDSILDSAPALIQAAEWLRRQP